MERSLAVERSHHGVDSVLAAKPIESDIKIDSISIDLIDADGKTEEKCDHFSIRGYVSEIRKKDWKRCCPFASDGDTENKTCILPPLLAPKFRFWRCDNCLLENGAKATASGCGAVRKSCAAEYTSSGICPRSPNHGDAIMLQSNFQHAPKEGICDGRKFVTNASCHLNNPAVCPPLSCTDKRKKKSEAAYLPIKEHSMGSEDNLKKGNPRLNHVTPQATSSQLQMTNQADDQTAAFKSKASGRVDPCEPGYVHHEVANADCAGDVNCMVKSATKSSETGNKISTDDQKIQNTKTVGCGAFGEAGNVDGMLNADNGHATGHPSVELDEPDQSSSKSDDSMAGSKEEASHENSSPVPRRKARKVRLLTELLDGNGGGDADNVRTEDSWSNAIVPHASEAVDEITLSQGEVSIQRKLRRSLLQNKKRKLLQDENWRPPEMSSPSKVCKEVRALKRDAATTDAIAGSKTEDACARKDLLAGLNWIKHKSERSPSTGKKKNKRVLIFDESFSSSSQENVPNEIKDGIGDWSKGNATGDVSVNPVQDAATRTEIELFPLSDQRIEKGASKGKMLQFDDRDSPISWNHAIMRESPMMGKNAQMMQTGSLTAPFHAAQDATQESRLNLSLNCYNSTQGYNDAYVPPLDKRSSLLNWQEGSPSEQVMRNTSDSRYAGNINFTSKMSQDSFLRKGLHGEMSNKRTTYKRLQDAPHENVLNLSLNSYSAAQRYEGNFVSQVGNRKNYLLNYQEASPEEELVTRRAAEAKYNGNFSFASKSAMNELFAKGLNNEQNGKRSTNKMHLLNDKQNHHSQVESRSYPLMQPKHICSASTSKTTIEPLTITRKSVDQRVGKVGEQGASDDIPMEIVELMAKNQYERCLPDAENDKRWSEVTCKKSGQTMDSRKLYGHGELNLFQQETVHKQNSQSINGMMQWGGNVGLPKQKSVDYFAQADRNQLNLGHMDRTTTPAGFGAFLQPQEKPPIGVRYSLPSSSGQNGSQNCKWFGDSVGKGSSHNSLHVSGLCNTCQNIPQQSREANHLWPTMMQNQIPFVYSIPQKHVGLSPNIDGISHSIGVVHKEHNSGCLNTKFQNQNPSNLGKQNNNFGSQTLNRTHSEYPFAGKHIGIEINQKPVGSIDLYSNETIPAMHLLSLMDAGLRSSTPIGMDVAPKFLDRPSIASDHDPKEFPRPDSGPHKGTNAVKHPLYDYLGKNQLVENSHERTPVTPTTAGACGSSSQLVKSFKKPTGFSSQVSEDKKRKVADSHTQNSGYRSQQNASRSGSFRTNCGLHSMQTILLGAPDSVAFTLPSNAPPKTSKKQKMESRRATIAAHLKKLSLETEICTLNRNPSDFSLPEAGNVYMIEGEDLKFRKPFPCTNGPGSIKLDGHKRQRKLQNVEEHGRHVTS